MTTQNIEELRLLAQTLEFSDAVRCSIQRAADLLQSQAERIAELETDIARKSDAVQRLWKERDTLRAEIAEIAATEPVFYEYQWTNPRNQLHQPESMFVWARVEPAWNGTVQQKVDELLAYRYDDKPTYRVRALFTRLMPAQGVTELVEALEMAVKLNSFREFNDHIPAMRDALSKYKGAK